MAIVAKENTWHRRLYKELHHVESVPPTPVYGDNSASIMMLDTGVTKRSRHYAIEWFLVRNRVDDGELVVDWVPTDANLADFFTKKLPRARFVALRNQIMDDEPVIANCVFDEQCDCDGSLPSHIRRVDELVQDAWMGEFMEWPPTPVIAAMARVAPDGEEEQVEVQEDPEQPEAPEALAIARQPEAAQPARQAQAAIDADCVGKCCVGSRLYTG